jgi:hypothetical protein
MVFIDCRPKPSTEIEQFGQFELRFKDGQLSEVVPVNSGEYVEHGLYLQRFTDTHVSIAICHNDSQRIIGLTSETPIKMVVGEIQYFGCA